MAEKNFTNTSSVETNAFIKGMVKDPNASFVQKENWTHARNTVNNSVDGDVAVIGNEPSNIQCASVPYPIIGAIHTYRDQWVIFATDDVNSEIGLFDDSECKYTTLINAPCLNFNRKHLITGAAKENFDCTWQVYWDDGNNPSRTLNINKIPYIRFIVSAPGADCIEYADTTELDCEKIRLAPLLTTPCVKLTKASDGGQLRNGSFQAFIAYTVNGQRQTDYIGVSNVQSLFDHNDLAGSLHINVTNLDKEFDYYELVILSNNTQNTVAKRIGLYSTEQSDITIDYIDQALVSVPLEVLPLRSPAYEKSDQMYTVNDWLIRSGPTEQFDFNYQPLANQIQANWVVAEYPENYYYKGGNKTGFMRDEQYAFFIRWIYNTGERSSSYHIPGRGPRVVGQNQFGDFIDETAINVGQNSLSPDEYNFQVFNTATQTAGPLNIPTDDGGAIIAKGDMAYWESTERYPATRPDIWNANNNPAAPWATSGNPQHDLCGKPIRHHKMPSEETSPSLVIHNTTNKTIRILGVEFSNIALPRFNDGSIIPNIVGYELLRGSREGQKSILAKGIFRNMRTYAIPNAENDTSLTLTGLYPNYPYNDLRPDVYFHDGRKSKRTDGCDDFTQSRTDYQPLGKDSNVPGYPGYRQDVFTFHGPDLMFKRPFLSAYETRLYGALHGDAVGYFIKSENHPQNKLLRNASVLIAAVIGIGYAINQIQGTRHDEAQGPTSNLDSLSVTTVGGLSAAAAGAITGYFTSANLNYLNPVAFGDLLKLSNLLAGNGVNAATFGTMINTNIVGSAIPGVNSGTYNVTFEFNKPTSNVPSVIQAFTAIFLSITNIAVGAQEIIDLLYNLVSFSDFAYKHNSHGVYENYAKTLDQNIIYRSKNTDSNYIGSSFQGFGSSYKINNLFRPGTVAVETQNSFLTPPDFTGLNGPLPPAINITDISRYTIGGDATDDFGNAFMDDPGQKQKKKISALYGALKFGFENQYGQLDGIKQVQMRGCIELVETNNPLKKYTSQAIFSGDTYVGRYTEKTIMPIFTDFLYGQPDQYPYDYLKRINIPYPRFWMDTRKYDTSTIAKALFDPGRLLGLTTTASLNSLLPNDLFYLDRGQNNCGLIDQISNTNDNLNSAFAMRTAYMYTHCNGIQDFYVESEINLAQRDWEDDPRYRHYDPYEYNNVDDLFNAAIIRDGNFYKYDYSLSVSRFLTNLSSFGNLQLPDYDPLVAEKCYSYYPKRLIYSLQAQLEAKKDFWRVFLPNNYKDFKSKVNVIKPINKNGAIIFFPYLSPQMFQGLDTLETDLGTKLTIGDGGLFSQPFQNVANSDLSNEYGSCESSRSVINTPFGLFFISQAQGKVFQYTGNLVNIANAGMKWWFNKYLPSVLVRQFPELEDSKLSDNPVIGIGCQAIYDINDDIVYFTKKDYAVREEYLNIMSYDPVTQKFLLNSTTVVPLGDPIFFENCSWTVSYDPKANAWISFHDWHPDLVLPSIRHFLTAKTQATSQPQCPPNYNYNPVTGKCERTQQITERAPVVVDEVARTIEFIPAGDCLLDIIIAVDTSASGGGPGSLTGQAQREFVKKFIDEPRIQAGLLGKRIQIGIVSFSGSSQQVSMNPNGYTMSWGTSIFNILSGSDVDTWLSNPAVWFNSGTKDLSSGMFFAQSVLNSKTTSQLNSGLRPSDPDFKQLILMVSDFTSPGPAGYGCSYQSALFPPATGTNYDQWVYSIFCRDSFPGNVSIVTAATDNTDCFNFYKKFQAYGNNLPFISTTTMLLVDDICGLDRFECKCPPGYVQVWKDSNNEFTLPGGLCEAEVESLCRKVTCNCPPPPFPGSVTTQSGVCDNVYEVGKASHINPDPVICKYYTLQQTPPSYTLGTLWRHNDRCDSYSNFYGISYPWEVEFTETTGQNVNTLRSIEYQLECYVYKGDLINECGDDRWHDLDWNFDEAIIYNTEQVSGLLRLELNPKDDPFGMMQYPIIGPSDIRILFSKEEQKYRFNQFWDITKDRGEFTSAQDRIFFTQLNGYIRDLNAANMNYQKPSDQRKKFRHYYNRVILRRVNSADRKMLLKLANTKLNLSFR